METIVLALIVLSNFTGFSGGNSYETTPFHHNDEIIENFGGTSKKEISSIVRREDVYNSGGGNEYLLYEFDRGAYSLDIDEKNIFFYCSIDEPVWGFRLRIEPNESHNRGKLSITLKNVDVVLV